MSDIIFTPVAVRERDCRERTELNTVELRLVVALIAARRVGRAGATRQELIELTGLHANSNFNLKSLERRLWIMDVARVARSTTHIWAATPRAAARLELCGWQVVLFSEEELGRVDPNLPGFLEDARAAS